MGSGPSAPPIWECWQYINYISFICWSRDLRPLPSESADNLSIIFLYLWGSGPSAPHIWECWQFINYISFISHLRVLTVYRLYSLYLLSSGPSAPHIWDCWQFIYHISFISWDQNLWPLASDIADSLQIISLLFVVLGTFSPSHLRVLTVFKLYFFYFELTTFVPSYVRVPTVLKLYFNLQPLPFESADHLKIIILLFSAPLI